MYTVKTQVIMLKHSYDGNMAGTCKKTVIKTYTKNSINTLKALFSAGGDCQEPTWIFIYV